MPSWWEPGLPLLNTWKQKQVLEKKKFFSITSDLKDYLIQPSYVSYTFVIYHQVQQTKNERINQVNALF